MSKIHKKYNTLGILPASSRIPPRPFPEPSRRAFEKNTFSLYDRLTKLKCWHRSGTDIQDSQNPSENFSGNRSQNLSKILQDPPSLVIKNPWKLRVGNTKTIPCCKSWGTKRRPIESQQVNVSSYVLLENCSIQICILKSQNPCIKTY